jgi:hypothetical protein
VGGSGRVWCIGDIGGECRSKKGDSSIVNQVPSPRFFSTTNKQEKHARNTNANALKYHKTSVLVSILTNRSKTALEATLYN